MQPFHRDKLLFLDLFFKLFIAFDLGQHFGLIVTTKLFNQLGEYIIYYLL
jgi:hypothetical protein